MEIIMTPTQRALSPTQIDLADYVLNPFKGCLLGCLYCYARSNRQIRRLGKTWGDFLYIKESFLSRLESGLDAAGEVDKVLIGSTTEPFQPYELAEDLIKEVLCCLGHRKIPCVILTKSAAVANFLPYLQYSARNHIYLTCNSPRVRTLFEKRSPLQEERIRAAGILTSGGVRTTVYISPVFPGLTNTGELLKALHGQTREVALESYNPKLGNWGELRLVLNEEERVKLASVYASRESYQSYWSDYCGEINRLNKRYEFQLTFNIYPYDSYYNQF